MSTEATPAGAAPEMPVIATSTHTGPLHVMVVGAGGTGARVIPPLTQMMRRGDVISIVDHDIVEDRNLLRQHFAARDIGSPKATVLADRYRKDGIFTAAFQTQLQENELSSTISNIYGSLAGDGQHRPRGLVVIGCVDNARARRAMQGILTGGHYSRMNCAYSAWIDVGNEMRGGQVMLNLHNWPLKVAGKVTLGAHGSILAGIQIAMPQLLRDRPEEAAELSCADRIDLQTVQVNHMASCMALNMLSWLMLGIPFTSAGMFFSTLNTVQPIRLETAIPGQLIPEKSFVLAA